LAWLKIYANIGNVLYNQGNYDQLLDYHRRALTIHEELQDKVGMAKDYANIGLVLADIKNHKEEAIESFSKGLEIFQELEQNTGYHHPLSDKIQADGHQSRTITVNRLTPASASVRSKEVTLFLRRF